MRIGGGFSRLYGVLIYVSLAVIIIGLFLETYLGGEISEGLMLGGLLIMILSPIVGVVYLALYYLKKDRWALLYSIIVLVIALVNLLYCFGF